MINSKMTHNEVSFSEWHSALCDIAAERGESAADADAWREDYDNGKTPLEAWVDEWGSDDL